jgi:hypothetical protein
MTRFRQGCHAVWGNAQAQDLVEYAVMVAVILLLVIGTLKLIGKNRSSSPVGPTAPSLTR